MMWELIRQNRRKSMFLFAGMAVLLSVLGFSIGAAIAPDGGGIYGLVIAVGMWAALTLIALNSGGQILLHVSGAKEVTRDVHPRLFNVVEEMKIAAGLPGMPKVYIIDTPSPNAFAIGLSQDKSAVAVTAGLLERLNRDELQGVMAHEVAHILNQDSRLMTVAGIMLGSIILLSHFFLRSWWFLPSSGGRYRKSGSGGGPPQLQLLMIAVTIVLAILAPIFARLLYLAISRKREYLADATAARLTRYPEGLASALEKMAGIDIPLDTANQVTAPMYIVNPLARGKKKLYALTSTHPPTRERIKILRSMSSGAGYQDYQNAFAKVRRGKSAPLIPASGLSEKESVAIREPFQEPEEVKDKKKTQRDVGDLMRALNEYTFLVCACGLKMKIPPEMTDPKIDCPRCGRSNEVPVAQLTAAAAMVGAMTGGGKAEAPADAGEDPPRYLEYTRKGSGWESFSCACGRILQLSPAFSGSHLSCKNCGRVTRIKE